MLGWNLATLLHHYQPLCFNTHQMATRRTHDHFQITSVKKGHDSRTQTQLRKDHTALIWKLSFTHTQALLVQLEQKAIISIGPLKHSVGSNLPREMFDVKNAAK